EWGDDSVSLTPNAAEGRLRLEARHEAYGRAGLGTYRALVQDGEVGRYHRPLFGPYVELKTGPSRDDTARAGVEAFGGSLSDPSRLLTAVPAHEELRATGGSLYYLGAVSVAEGSELVRVEVRDGVTGLPLGERHLVRGRDYDIDYFSGRILLARPLSFLAGESWLRTGAPTEAPEPVLVVDYAALRAADAEDTAGGELWGEWRGARLGLAAVREGREGRRTRSTPARRARRWARTRCWRRWPPVAARPCPRSSLACRTRRPQLHPSPGRAGHRGARRWVCACGAPGRWVAREARWTRLPPARKGLLGWGAHAEAA
ncbi:hypothetical protein ACLESD_52740, partial [Pyxidicoccus sp. 3LFB2]